MSSNQIVMSFHSDAVKDDTLLVAAAEGIEALAQPFRFDLDLVVAPAVITAIAGRCTEVETGARNIDHILAGTLLPQISTALLSRMAAGTPPKGLALGVGADGAFTLSFTEG